MLHRLSVSWCHIIHPWKLTAGTPKKSMGFPFGPFPGFCRSSEAPLQEALWCCSWTQRGNRKRVGWTILSWRMFIYFYIFLLKPTAILPLKMDDWKILLGWPIFRDCVSFRECGSIFFLWGHFFWAQNSWFSPKQQHLRRDDDDDPTICTTDSHEVNRSRQLFFVLLVAPHLIGRLTDLRIWIA